ncbi:hypothetical protein IW262DRAFT_1345470, partial [Armillaria fumosa]
HVRLTVLRTARALHIVGYLSQWPSTWSYRLHSTLGGYRPVPSNITNWVTTRASDDCRLGALRMGHGGGWRMEDVEGRRQDRSSGGCMLHSPVRQLATAGSEGICIDSRTNIRPPWVRYHSTYSMLKLDDSRRGRFHNVARSFIEARLRRLARNHHPDWSFGEAPTCISSALALWVDGFYEADSSKEGFRIAEP